MSLSEQELRILNKSLDFISSFPEALNTSPEEYVKIHQRNLTALSELASERNSDFIKNKINTYDTISEAEIAEYLKWKRNEVSIIDLFFGRLASVFMGLIKNKGNSRQAIARKVNHIAMINTDLKKVIENPYLETILE